MHFLAVRSPTLVSTCPMTAGGCAEYLSIDAGSAVIHTALHDRSGLDRRGHGGYLGVLCDQGQ